MGSTDSSEATKACWKAGVLVVTPRTTWETVTIVAKVRLGLAVGWVVGCEDGRDGCEEGSARARFGFLFGVRVHSQYRYRPCPSHVQRLFFIQHIMRVTSMALIAALSFSPMVLFLTLLFDCCCSFSKVLRCC